MKYARGCPTQNLRMMGKSHTCTAERSGDERLRGMRERKEGRPIEAMEEPTAAWSWREKGRGEDGATR